MNIATEQERELAQRPVGGLLWKYSLPAIAAMLMDSIYNLVDAIFIGRGVGPYGLSAIAVAFPVQLILYGAFLCIGIGTASVVSRALGEGDRVRAARAVGNAVLAVLGVSILLNAVFQPLLDPLLHGMGARGAVLPLAREYISIYLFGAFFFCVGHSFSHIVRAEGRPHVAMTIVFVANGINLVLDPLFIFGFGWGMAGAALATVIALFSASLFAAYYYISGRSGLRLVAASFRPDVRLIGEIFGIGASMYIRLALASLLNIVVNNILVRIGGPMHLAMLSMVYRLMIFAYMPLYGIAQACQPIIGYNYGAGNNDRVWETLKRAVIAGFIYCSVVYVFLFALSGPLLRMFSGEEQLVLRGTPVLRLTMLLFPLASIQIVIVSALQSLGRAGAAFFLNIANHMTFLPVILVFSGVFGLPGVWLTYPVADFVAFLSAYLVIMWQLRSMGRRSAEVQPAEAG